MATALSLPREISLRARLRIVVRLAAMVLLFAVCVPFYYLYRLIGIENPWPRVFLGGVATIAGLDIAASGPRPIRPVFLIANHVSWLDIPVLSWITGSAFVGHDGLAAMPLLKELCAMNGTVFIARHDRASVAEQIEQVRGALAHTLALTIFPEGTTSDGTGLLPFKSALLSACEPLPAGIDVQPVLLDYGAEAADIAWIGEEHGLHNFLRILARRRRLRVEVKFLAPLAGADAADRKAIAAAARSAMLGAFAR